MTRPMTIIPGWRLEQLLSTVPAARLAATRTAVIERLPGVAKTPNKSGWEENVVEARHGVSGLKYLDLNIRGVNSDSAKTNHDAKLLEDVHVRDLPFSRPKRGVGIAVSVR